MSSSKEPHWQACLTEAGAVIASAEPEGTTWRARSHAGPDGAVVVEGDGHGGAQRYELDGHVVRAEVADGVRRVLSDVQLAALAGWTRAYQRYQGGAVSLQLALAGRTLHVLDACSEAHAVTPGQVRRFAVGAALSPLSWSLQALVETDGFSWLPGGLAGRPVAQEAPASWRSWLPTLVVHWRRGARAVTAVEGPLQVQLAAELRQLTPPHRRALVHARIHLVGRLQGLAADLGLEDWAPHVAFTHDVALESLRAAVLAAPRLREVLARAEASAEDLTVTPDGVRALEAFRLAGGAVDDGLLGALRSPPAVHTSPEQRLRERAQGRLASLQVAFWSWCLERVDDELQAVEQQHAVVAARIRVLLDAVATQLVEAGELADQQDIQWLTVQECLGWLAGAPPMDIAAAVALRERRANATRPDGEIWHCRGPVHPRVTDG